MKQRTRNILIRTCSVAMCAAMVAGVGLTSGSAGKTIGTVAAANSASGLIDVTGQYDTDALRSQYLNQDAVAPNLSVKNEKRWVVVDLGGTSLMDAFEKADYAATFADYANTTAAASQQAQMQRTQNAFLAQLAASGIEYEYKYSYTTLNNGVAIRVKNSDIAAVSKLIGVKGVYASEAYAAPKTTESSTNAVSNNAHVYTTGIYDTSDVAYQGEGMVVAVLDTGLDYTHPAFSYMPAASTARLTSGEVEGKLQTLESYRRVSLDISDVYYNLKVPYAYDYADDDNDVYPSYSSHGTHVAGIVAGRDDEQVVNVDTNEKFIGVAPEAQLVICKVFSDDLDLDVVGSANSIDILAALSDCVTLGVDVINMSLGTSVGFSEEGFANAPDYLANAYEKVEKAGISLVCAASNDYSSGLGGAYGTNLASNPDSGTVGSPSTYPSTLSVASIEGKESDYFQIGNSGDVAFITQSTDANGNQYEFLDLLYEKYAATTGTAVDKSEPLVLNYVLIGGVGRSANYTQAIKNSIRNAPTIAVVERGDISFAEKVQNAMQAGAFACLVYNNVSGSIRMTLGEVVDPIPTASISMDAGKLVKANGSSGTLTFAYGQSAGPFMSDYSSWGPTPDLKIKPEITAHGGQITSAVPGGYESLSGTSMASPNMSGAIALLRQYAQQKWPELKTSDDVNALSNRVYQLLMSTATMARNEEGNPYSPRKQGAGLAGVADAIRTQGYLTVEGETKPKLELGDDPNKTGVYEMSFTVNSISSTDTSYTPVVYVMTESLSSDEKTVAEKAYMLNDHATIEIRANGNAVDGSVTVPAGGKLSLTVKITLDKEAKQYLDDTFENGMYVEGYIRLTSSDQNVVELGLPYLAFYGDWTQAPMFDYSTYEVEESEADKSVEEEDKLKASAAATRPLGLYDNEQYIVTLGSYLYDMADNYTKILPTDERAAISMFDYSGRKTIYELYVLYAGLLRAAKTMDIVVTDSATGEVVYTTTEKNVRKSYAAGGSNIGAMINLEMDPLSWNMSNNKTYVVSLKGVLDYDVGEGREHTTQKNEYSFQFTVDTESPRVTDYRIRYEPYTENKETKYRIYLDADVSDNQYVMSLLPCYIDEKQELALLSQFPIPVYSTKGGTTTVTYEITDCFEEYVKTGNFYLVVEDYALNQGMYRLEYAEATDFPSSLKLTTDDKLTYAGTDSDDIPVYNLTLSQYENYKVQAEGLSTAMSPTAFTFISANGVVLTHENELFSAAASGTDTVEIAMTETTYDEAGNQIFSYPVLAKINVTVSSGGLSKPIIEKISLAPMLNAKNYVVSLTNGEIELNPNTTRQLQPSVEPWYTGEMQELKFTYSVDKRYEDYLTVDENGVIYTHATGLGYIEIGIEGNNSLLTRLKVTVGDELDITNYTLYHFYGGAIYQIPDNKNVMSIDEECFKDNTIIEELILPISLTSLPENAFSGCINLRKITIPAQCTVIHSNAFAGCESLEEVIFVEAEDKITGLPMTGTVTLGRNAFAGCTSLTTIENQQRITTANSYAFAGCTSLESIDLRGLRVGGDFIFDGCTNLETVTMSSLTHVGRGMFRNCTSLNDVVYYASTIPDYAFAGCTSLSAITLPDTVSYLGAYAFAETAFTSFTLPNGTYGVGTRAFAGCGELTTVTLSSSTLVDFGSAVFADCENFTQFAGTPAHLTIEGGVLYNSDGTEIVAVPYGKTDYTLLSRVTKIGAGAFAGTLIETIDLANVTEIGPYAFAESELSAIDISKIEVISEGAFFGCENLVWQDSRDPVPYVLVTVDDQGDSAIVEVGAYAFAGCVNLKQPIFLPSATTIGAHAFDSTPITYISGDEILTIGDFAFFNTSLSTRTNEFSAIRLPKLTTLGDFAFAGNAADLLSVELGPVTEMGDYAFTGCTNLRNFSLADGATVVGSWAFSTSVSTVNEIASAGLPTANKLLTNVTVPDTVLTIGDFAFINCTNLVSTNIDLSSVTYVGMGAFWNCEKVTGFDLSSLESVGGYAFYNCIKLTEANLENAKIIGNSAFFIEADQTTQALRGGIQTLNMPVAEQIGMMAFGGTALTTVTIPATLPFYYVDSWDRINDFGDPEARTGRQFYALGENAFEYCLNLTDIRVAEGNEHYFVDGGALYARIPDTDNYIFVTYPAANSQNSTDEYTVLENTVRIGFGAFYAIRSLKTIRIPATVKEIATMAFFACTAEDYYFESVQAPVLEAAYDATYEGSLYPYIYQQLASFEIAKNAAYDFLSYATNFGYGMFYSNFYNYVAYSVFLDYSAFLNSSTFTGLTLHCPENGSGYDSEIWKGFFAATEYTGYAADEVTLAAQAKIELLPTVQAVTEALAALSKDEQLVYIKALSAGEIRDARLSYNAIASDGQRALIAETYEKLLALEALVRDTREQLGDPVALLELEMTSRPAFTYYVGQKFNSEGMVLKAIYEDLSEVILKDGEYHISNEGPYQLGDTEIVFSYGGKEYTLYITVTEAPPLAEGSLGLIIGLSVGGAVVIAAVVVGIVLFLKKRAKKAPTESEATETEVTETPVAEESETETTEKYATEESVAEAAEADATATQTTETTETASAEAQSEQGTDSENE